MVANSEASKFQSDQGMRKAALWAIGHFFLLIIVWAEKGISSALITVPFLLAFQINIFFVFNVREVISGLLMLRKSDLAMLFLALLANGYLCYRQSDNLIFYSILWVLPLFIYWRSSSFWFCEIKTNFSSRTRCP